MKFQEKIFVYWRNARESIYLKYQEPPVRGTVVMLLSLRRGNPVLVASQTLE